MIASICVFLLKFLSTLSLRRATFSARSSMWSSNNFYPRSPCGERLPPTCARLRARAFLSTLSLRRATYRQQISMDAQAFLSTLSLRRATHPTVPGLEAGGYFYPRSPCGERPMDIFLATPCPYFYPRSPCGERPRTGARGIAHKPISIHALLAESDFSRSAALCCISGFLSTLSLRRATRWAHCRIAAWGISIHALLAESDGFLPDTTAALRQFLSTLSLRRATPHGTGRPRQHCISIHALLAESDRYAVNQLPVTLISIHALLAESDVNKSAGRKDTTYFYPRSPCGERRYLRPGPAAGWPFLSTLSLRRATR